MALGYYAEPRQTSDIDVNVFVPAKRWPMVRDALAPLGVDVEIDEAKLEAEAQIKLSWDENPVHLFFSCDPLHKAMELAVRTVRLDDGTIPLVAPEHLVIRKTLLGRPKDQHDIEQILATIPIDLKEVDVWVERLTD